MAKRGTLDHEKNLTLSEELGIDPCFSLGILEAFWQWVAEKRKDGDLTGVNPKHIAKAMLYSGDPQQLWDALVTSGWIDVYESGKILVHDWSEHADNAVHQSLKRKKQAFADGHQPFTRNKPSDVTVSQRCHDSDVTVSFPPGTSSQIPDTRKSVVPKTQGELSAHLATLSAAEHLAFLRELGSQGNQWALAELQRLEAASPPDVQRPAAGTVTAEFEGYEPPPPKRDNAHPANASAGKQVHSRGQAMDVTPTLPAEGAGLNLPADGLAAAETLRQQALRLFRGLEGAFAKYYHNPPMGRLAEDLLKTLEWHVSEGRTVTAADVQEAIRRRLEEGAPKRRYADELTVHLGNVLLEREEEAAAPAPVQSGREPDYNARRAITSAWARAIWDQDTARQQELEQQARSLYAGLSWQGAALEEALSLVRRDASTGVSVHQERARLMRAHQARQVSGGSLA